MAEFVNRMAEFVGRMASKIASRWMGTASCGVQCPTKKNCTRLAKANYRGASAREGGEGGLGRKGSYLKFASTKPLPLIARGSMARRSRLTVISVPHLGRPGRPGRLERLGRLRRSLWLGMLGRLGRPGRHFEPH